MAYADALRTTTFGGTDIATLIENICSSSGNLTFTDYVPGTPWTQGSTMSYTSVTTSLYKYCLIGKLFIAVVSATGTTGGTGVAELRIPLPVTLTSTTAVNLFGKTNDGGTLAGGAFGTSSTTTTCGCYKAAFTAWGIGAARAIDVIIIGVTA